ncbi:MAG: PLP-dependent aminotransferase family protein, partial [Nocardiopsaceae bacterium]|nr:PLP-dependent aminotransferase family protein [Nocardiopsaceae bacterium]
DGGAIDTSWQSVALGERVIDTAGMSPLADPPGPSGELPGSSDLPGASGEVISLASGYPHSSLMPTRALNAALARAARLPGAWDRPPAAGITALRAWFAREASARAEPGDVLIAPGGQAAISAIFRAVLRPGDPLLAESPTYPGALAAARLAGLRVFPVPVDAEGVVPDLLAGAFARSGARAFYCQPAYHNPAGTVLAAGRREQVLAIARAAGAFVIEDDACRWLSHGRRTPPPLLDDDPDGRVIYLTSLTKAASPSLRVGAAIARGPAAARLRATLATGDLFVARPLQEAALDLVTRPGWQRHLRDLGRDLGLRAQALSAAVREHLPGLEFAVPDGGVHLWARVPGAASAGSPGTGGPGIGGPGTGGSGAVGPSTGDPDTDDADLAFQARRAGVIVMPGRPFFPAEPPGPFLRLTFSAAPSPARLTEAVRRLATLPALAGRA